MNLLQLSWKNLTNKPLTMLLSLVLFALGVGLISLVFLLEKQLDEQFRRNMDDIDMVIGAKGSPLQLVLSSIFHLDAPTGNINIGEARAFLRPGHPLIERAVPLSLGDSYGGYRIVGTTNAMIEHYGAELAEGALWQASMEVTLGANAARRLGLDLRDRFQSTHGLDINEDLVHEDAEAFKVVGILQPAGTVLDQLILTAPKSVWEVHGEHGKSESGKREAESGSDRRESRTDEGGRDRKAEATAGSPVPTKEVGGESPAPDSAAAAAEAHDHDHEAHDYDAQPLHEKTEQDITAILVTFKARNVQTLNMPRMINENTNLMAANPSYEISKLFDQLGRGEKILRILGIVIVIVSSFSIFISLYNSLKERRYELAIMRTLGASPGRLFLLIILEGLVLAVLGYLLGILLSHAGIEIGARIADDTYRYPFTGWAFLREEGWLLLGAVGIGFLAALLPAIEARNTDIHETLAEG